MRTLFVIIALCLVIAAAGTYLTLPNVQSDVPILYWVTDANPARAEQVRLFHEWLIDQGLVTEDGKPIVELRLDTSIGTGDKKVIQGVSGVAGDIIDASGDFDLSDFVAIGLLEDVTGPAKKLGFDPSTTYKGVEPLITINGRQYGYPCNVGVLALWANVDTFEKLGMEPPPRYWDFDTFERIGKEFVRRANTPGARQEAFFLNSPIHPYYSRMITVMHRSLGLSIYNETLTRCTLDDERYVQVLERLYKWVYEDHLFPSAAEQASFSGESGYGGNTMSMFMRGQYAMVITGRWGLIRLRQFKERPRFTVCAFPCDMYRNMEIGTRPAGIYKASRHKDLAAYFLAFLASEPYNMDIVKSADALPPNPKYAKGELFSRPPEYPNEWGCHDAVLELAQQDGVPKSVSPYISQNAMLRTMQFGWDKLLENMMTAREAADETARRAHLEIERTLEQRPTLRPQYEADLKLQEKIDAYRQQGRPVPLDWIKNPFYRRYYLDQGWAVESAEETP